MEWVKQGMYSHRSAWTVPRKESKSGVDRTASDRSSERVALRENLVELSSLRRDEDPSGTENRKRSTKKTRIIRSCWEPGYYNPTVYVSLLSEPFGFNCVYFSIQTETETETEVNPQRLKQLGSSKTRAEAC
jgi:hypothetical protein